ncbi:MAG: dihydroxy-acid dehydratase [Actinobacteria bacterium]|nr:dihydroxy-acid dehydratase [Actinomycetota bacterium]
MTTNGKLDPKHNSRALTDGPARAPARAYLHGIGFDAEALSKPIIGVASTWIETMPCNFHLRALAAKVKEGIREAAPPALGDVLENLIQYSTSGVAAFMQRAAIAALEEGEDFVAAQVWET